LLALIRFPSTLFNSTHLENYVKINDGLRSKIRRVRAPSSRVRLAGVALGALAAAGFELVAEGDFDSKLWPLVGSVVGMALAFLVVSAAFEAPEVLMTTDKGSRHLLDALRVLPGGLVFAGLCAGLSWWLQLNPGYVYGTIAGFVVTSKKRSRRDTEENSGYAAAIASACVGLLTLVAGGLWFLINDWVTATGWMTVPKVAIAIFAATTFAASAQGLVFDYIPLEFLQGENLLHWSRLVWATVFGASLAITISVITAVVTDNGRIDIEWWRVVSAYGALLFFAGLSLRFWNHYRGADPPAEDEPALGESESDTQELVGAKR
jgi:hypothetical protein